MRPLIHHLLIARRSERNVQASLTHSRARRSKQWFIPLIPLVLIAFVAGSFAMGNGSTTCIASAPDEHFVGDACTSETISMATVWSWSESTTALPAQKLLLLVVVLAVLATTAFPKIPSSTRGLTWFNRRVNLARTGPSPHKLFLPYLFATHGF